MTFNILRRMEEGIEEGVAQTRGIVVENISTQLTVTFINFNAVNRAMQTDSLRGSIIFIRMITRNIQREGTWGFS